MKNLKKLVTTLTLAGIIIIGITDAKAGMLMSDFTGGDSQPQQQCTENLEKTENVDNVDNGILVSSFGILVSSFGILVSSFTKTDETNTECED